MTEPTDTDRAKAEEIIPRHRGLCNWDWHTGPKGPGCTCGAESERDAITAALTEARTSSMEELNQILHNTGIDYPQGLRGVRDLVNQRDGYLEDAKEAEDAYKKLRADVLALAQEMDDASDARDGQLDGYFYAEHLRAVVEDET